jgi:hypothetical protein
MRRDGKFVLVRLMSDLKVRPPEERFFATLRMTTWRSVRRGVPAGPGRAEARPYNGKGEKQIPHAIREDANGFGMTSGSQSRSRNTSRNHESWLHRPTFFRTWLCTNLAMDSNGRLLLK